MRINIWIPSELLSNVDAYCADHRYGRSELIQELLREKVGGDSKGGVGETKKGLLEKSEGLVVEKEVSKKLDSNFEKVESNKESWKDSNQEPAFTFKRDKGSLVESIEKQKGMPLFCPKHKGQRIGNIYACCGLLVT